jgi:hypothetical protein
MWLLLLYGTVIKIKHCDGSCYQYMCAMVLNSSLGFSLCDMKNCVNLLNFVAEILKLLYM